MPEHSWICPNCDEINPPLTEVCRKCNAQPSFDVVPAEIVNIQKPVEKRVIFAWIIVVLGIVASVFIEFVYLMFVLAGIGNTGGSSGFDIFAILLIPITLSIAYIFLSFRLLLQHRYGIAAASLWYGCSRFVERNSYYHCFYHSSSVTAWIILPLNLQPEPYGFPNVSCAVHADSILEPA